MHDLVEQSGFVDVKYAQIFYQIFSTQATYHQTPLVIIAGGPGSSYDYLLTLKCLAYDRPVIFYNQSGCGNSVVAQDAKIEWSVAHYCQELKQLLKVWGFESYHILGHSWGGTLAIEYALQHVANIKSLVLASPYVSADLYVQDVQCLVTTISSQLYDDLVCHEQQGNVSTYEYIAMVFMIYEHFFCRMSYWPYELVQALLTVNQEIYTTMWSRFEMSVSGNLKDIDYLSQLSKIVMPTLITCGRFDVITPKSMVKVNELIENSALLVFENSSHVPHLEEEAAYCASIKNFLDKHDMLSVK